MNPYPPGDPTSNNWTDWSDAQAHEEVYQEQLESREDDEHTRYLQIMSDSIAEGIIEDDDVTRFGDEDDEVERYIRDP